LSDLSKGGKLLEIINSLIKDELKNVNPNVRINAARALVQIGLLDLSETDKKIIINELVTALEDSDFKVVAEVAKALSQINLPEGYKSLAINKLVDVLKHSSNSGNILEVAKALEAARTLGQIGLSSLPEADKVLVINELAAALTGYDTYARRVAAEGLIQIGGNSIAAINKLIMEFRNKVGNFRERIHSICDIMIVLKEIQKQIGIHIFALGIPTVEEDEKKKVTSINDPNVIGQIMRLVDDQKGDRDFTL